MPRAQTALLRIAPRRIVANVQPGRQAPREFTARLRSIAFVILRACWGRRLGDLGKIMIGRGLHLHHGVSGCPSRVTPAALHTALGFGFYTARARAPLVALSAGRAGGARASFKPYGLVVRCA